MTHTLPPHVHLGATHSAIRLVELGPRLTLSLLKIEEGLCDGEVLYHSFSALCADAVPRRVH